MHVSGQLFQFRSRFISYENGKTAVSVRHAVPVRSEDVGGVFTRFETTSAYICFITDTSSVSYAGQLMPRLQIRKCLSVCMWEVQRGAGGQAVS